MKKPNILDRAIMTMAPVHAAKRAAARVALSVIKSGYGSYGANLTKKSMRGWMYHGGSAKEDIEDNIDILQQRSRDAYMGIPTATAALKTMRTNVVAGGLMSSWDLARRRRRSCRSRSCGSSPCGRTRRYATRRGWTTSISSSSSPF